MYPVYIRLEGLYVTEIAGGTTDPDDKTDWVKIDEGDGDRFYLAQAHYLDKPIIDDAGAHNFIFSDGVLRETTQAEKQAEIATFERPVGLDKRIRDAVNDLTYDRFSALEKAVEAATYTIQQLSHNVQLVEKRPDDEMPLGDYLNPIKWNGQAVTAGLFYYLVDKNLPAEALKSGSPDFWSPEWFDIVEV